MKETDEAVYSRFLRERKEEDLRILLERHREGLTFFLYEFTHDMDDAEELMIDSFAEVATGKPFFTGKSSFRTWLFAIGKNLARMRLRRKSFETVDMDQAGELADSSPEPEEIAVLDDEKAELYRAMRKLRPEARRVLYLIYFEEMSYEEVAEVLGKSRKQTYRLADRSRSELKKILEEQAK